LEIKNPALPLPLFCISRWVGVLVVFGNKKPRAAVAFILIPSMARWVSSCLLLTSPVEGTSATHSAWGLSYTDKGPESRIKNVGSK